MLPGIDLLQLFVEVVDAGSIAAAARKLDMSPSVASRKITALEQEFGTHLLIRTSRQMRLTEGGIALLDWARDTVKSYRSLDDNLAALQNRPTGTIRLACNDYAAVNYLPPLLRKFCTLYPGLRLSISTSPKPEQLLDASCDLLLHIGPRPEINVIARQVRRYARCLCASPAYIEAHGVPHTVDELSRHHCLTHSGGESREWYFSIEGQVVRQAIDPYIEVDSYAALYKLSEAGLGIARVSEALLQNAFIRRTMVKILPEATCVHSNGEIPGMWLLFPERKILHRTRLLADYLAQAIIHGYTLGYQFGEGR